MIRLFLTCTAMALPLVSCAIPAGFVSDPTLDRATYLDADAWVEETLESLPLRRKVAQMIVPWVAGEYMPVDGAQYDRLREWVVEDGVGGIIMSIGPPLEVAAKLNAIQALADVPLLIYADMESGPGMRLHAGVALPSGIDLGGGTRFPPLMAFGAAGDADLVYEMGRITALEARAVGVHMTFAPVVDVNNNPFNPIINTRSYGEDPAEVSRLAVAHVRGLQDHGLLATAKHFPGHGDTSVDSHVDLPVIGVDWLRTDSMELPPFRAAIQEGVAGVMSAHIAFPALTGDTVPATLSSRIMTGLLRDELGFDGLIVTDALNMGGIIRGYGDAQAAILAVHAGSDVLLMPRSVPEAIEAVASEVEAGRMSEARIDESVRKILQHKARLGLHRQRLVNLGAVAHTVGARSHQRVAQEVADRSITLVRDRGEVLPLRGHEGLRVLSITYSAAPDRLVGRQFQRTLGREISGLRTATLDGRSSAAELDVIKEMAAEADIVVFSPFLRVVAYQDDLAVDRDVASLINEVALERPVVLVSFGNPYLSGQFPCVSTVVLAWGRQDVSQSAAGRAVTGGIPFSGRLPISLVEPTTLLTTDRVPVLDAVTLAKVDSLVGAAIVEGVTPGAAVAIGSSEQVLLLKGYGRLDWDDAAPAVTDSSIYDLASLTKAVATTKAVMLLDEAGVIELDLPLSRQLSRWPTTGGKGAITPRQLLTHSGGFPSFRRFWRESRGRSEYLAAISELDLEYPPGEESIYSDLGMILLGMLVEDRTGETLDHFLWRSLYQPLGMGDTHFVPVSHDPLHREPGIGVPTPMDLWRYAPTEVDTLFRGVHVHGVVHDENAYALGGVAGHAGLFSSARDLALLSQFLLKGGRHEGRQMIQPTTIRDYVFARGGAARRPLGWQRAGSGTGFSGFAFGHTGFTGTSIWLDPERDLFIVLLTNRVNPTRDNQGHVPLRSALHDLLLEAIDHAWTGHR